jgi:hypothetical protein
LLLSNPVSDELKAINLALRKRIYAKEEIRERLARELGRFCRLSHFSQQEAREWAGGREVAAVDGSVNYLGALFPYILCIFRALARTTGGDRTAVTEVFSPLLPHHYRELTDLSREQDLDNELAVNIVKERKLVAFELQVAMETVVRKSPRLVIFDGGFVRYERHAPEAWSRYRQLALEKEIFSVGLIEEAGSFGLGRELNLAHYGNPVFDRELLLGLMEPGECFLVDFERYVKKPAFYTAFARLSRNPQAVAFDFFKEQARYASGVLNYLYTITPAGGRGVPLLLDIVDAEARISDREMDLLLEAYLDVEVRERFFAANRLRRDL